jgi:glycosyltransferase involved in cell wall biosynthesis
MLAPPVTVPGPIPTIARLLARGMREAGCTVEIAPWGRHSDGESAVAKAWGRIGEVLAARQRCRGATWDALLVHTSHDWKTLARDIPLVLACRGQARAIVLVVHGSRYEPLVAARLAPFSLATRLLVRLVDGVFVLSSEEQRHWSRLLPGRRFFVVANPFVGPAEPTLAPGPGAGGPGAADRRARFELLYVGRLIEEKGAHDLVSAVARLGPSREVRLRLAGAGPDAERLRRRVAELGLGDRVELCGRVTGAALWDLYASADVCVLPTYWKEGFPTVLAEAMSAGLPIVTTPIRGAVDHLEDGVNAVFVPPKDPRALAAAIGDLLDDPARRAAMSRNNRAKVADFDPAVVARTYVDRLREIVEDHPVRDHPAQDRPAVST